MDQSILTTPDIQNSYNYVINTLLPAVSNYYSSILQVFGIKKVYSFNQPIIFGTNQPCTGTDLPQNIVDYGMNESIIIHIYFDNAPTENYVAGAGPCYLGDSFMRLF